jgi:hypothetical protein
MAASKATQSFVPVKEVRSGVVVLKDGGYRGIMMCSSLNFALKSEDEQKSIIGGFQTFLNTLDFSVEIVVHSRKMDVRPYLALLSERMDAQATELMRIQLREYIQFIRNFIDGADIMTKMFYVVVPFTPSTGQEIRTAIPSLLSGGFGGGNKTQPRSAAEATEFEFGEHKVQLEQRMALVASGLGASGLRAVPLGTEEIIELLYRSFNLGEMDNPIRLSDA